MFFITGLVRGQRGSAVVDESSEKPPVETADTGQLRDVVSGLLLTKNSGRNSMGDEHFTRTISNGFDE